MSRVSSAHGVVPVKHTCPAIDKVVAIVTRHVPDSGPLWGPAGRLLNDRAAALLLLEEIRADNTQLRKNAALMERALAERIKEKQ